jgi:hypothetical protein
MTTPKSRKPASRRPRIRICDPARKLILSMLGTIEDLGNSSMARIDARAWADHYRRVAAGLGIIQS